MSKTREHLLDIAERLFAEHGIDGVSVRQVMETAQVNVSAVHYHFGSREELVQQVVRRIAEPMNAERLALLSTVESTASSDALQLEDVLRAFITPVFQLLEARPQAAWLLAHLYVSPNDAMRREYYTLFYELVTRFSQALHRTDIGQRDPRIMWTRVQFMWGAMIHTLSKPRRDASFANERLLPPSCSGPELIDQWIAFCAAGLRAA